MTSKQRVSRVFPGSFTRFTPFMKAKQKTKNKSVWISPVCHSHMKALCGVLGVSMQQLIMPAVYIKYKKVLEKIGIEVTIH
jgi:hypothetical protein